jgi:hypothetical protein
MGKKGKKWYREIRQHPEWFKLRTKVWARANNCCEHKGCTYSYDEKNPLDVHHIKYVKGKEPWDYPLDNFELLCRKHHSAKHKRKNSKTSHDTICCVCGEKIKPISKDEFYEQWFELFGNEENDCGWHMDANGEWYEVKDERPIYEQIDLNDLNEEPVDNGPPYFVCCEIFSSGSSDADSSEIRKHSSNSSVVLKTPNIPHTPKLAPFRTDSKNCASSNLERSQPSDEWKEKHLSKKSYRKDNEDIWGNIPADHNKLLSKRSNPPPKVLPKYQREDTRKGG